jgi:lysyl-tRNA synthetase class 2
MGIRTILERRAHVRRVVRELFDAGGFLEVDTPVLAAEVLPEAHIDPVAVRLAGAADPRWLQASPENLMKRLLAAGAGPIYQFAPAFRDGERGPQHDVEFTILEWYAPETSLDDVTPLLERLCAAVLGTAGLDRTTCAAAFLARAGIDPTTASPGELLAAVERQVAVVPEGLAALEPEELADRCFELLLSEVVQPRLGHARPVMLERWPAAQAAPAIRRVSAASTRTWRARSSSCTRWASARATRRPTSPSSRACSPAGAWRWPTPSPARASTPPGISPAQSACSARAIPKAPRR